MFKIFVVFFKMDYHRLLLVSTNLRNQFQADSKESWRKKLANLSFEMEGHLKEHGHDVLSYFDHVQNYL